MHLRTSTFSVAKPSDVEERGQVEWFFVSFCGLLFLEGYFGGGL